MTYLKPQTLIVSPQRPGSSVSTRMGVMSLDWWTRLVDGDKDIMFDVPVWCVCAHEQDLSTISPRRYESKTVPTKGVGKLKRKAVDTNPFATAPKRVRGYVHA